MMRSMFSGVSGLRSHQTKMDVIANNISNVNTIGFKSHRVTFAEVFYQKVSGASGPNPELGRAGVSSMQIGLGTSVGSISKVMTSGMPQRTDDPYDLMIDGEGFFIVGDVSGTYFTRAGSFKVDEDGYLATPGGLMVKGWQAIDDPNNVGRQIISKGIADDLQIMGPKQMFIDPQPTTQIDFSGNLNALTDPVKFNTLSFFDTVGNRYVVDVRLSYDQSTGLWDVALGDIAIPNNLHDNPVYLDFTNTATTDNPNGYPYNITVKQTPDPPDLLKYHSIGSVSFDTGGYPEGCEQAGRVLGPETIMNSLQVMLTIPDNLNPSPLVPNAEFGGLYSNPMTAAPTTFRHVINLTFDDIRQFGTQNANATTEMRNGNAPGKLDRVNISTDGKITGGYTNGLTKLLGQIVVAQFANPAGLDKIGDNLFVTTPNSGEFDGVGEEVQASGGNMMAGVLEMSNVDLSSEFTEMITTQRGFQANSRVITTSDDMLQELVNLKR